MLATRLGVCGYGTVGSAIGSRAKEVGFEVSLHDPAVRGSVPLVQLASCDAIVIAVPTPARSDGQLDMTSVSGVVRELDTLSYQGLIIISSTLQPGTYRKLSERHPRMELAVVPEFLRAATRHRDVRSPSRVVIGATKQSTGAKVRMIYAQLAPHAPSVVTSPEIAELTKLACNAFLALKVVFANEVESACRMAAIDWRSVSRLMGMDPRIGASHLQVTPTRGFAGHCLPKDTQALVAWSNRLGADQQLIATAIRLNSRHRLRTADAASDGTR